MAHDERDYGRSPARWRDDDRRGWAPSSRYRGGPRYRDEGTWDDRPAWAGAGRKLATTLRRFVLVTALVLIPLVILLVIGAVLLLMWLFGNGSPLTGILNFLNQIATQIGGIVNAFNGGAAGVR